MQVPPTVDQPSVDPSVLAELAALLGDDGPSVIDELISTYLEDTPLRISDVAQAILDADVERLRRAAHTLKSSSASIGAMSLSQLSAAIERATYTDPSGALQIADADALRAELDHVRQELEKLRSDEPVDQRDVRGHGVVA